jgi:sulfite exporter TauE/SafE
LIFIVAITWLYVILMMAVTERSLVGGMLTFLFYGLAPCFLLLWLTGAAAGVRARRRQRLAARAEAGRTASVVAEKVER